MAIDPNDAINRRKGLERIRHIPEQIKRLKRPSHTDVGSIALLAVIALVVLFLAFAMGQLSDTLLLVGIVIVFGLIYSQAPQLLLELKEYQRAVVLRMGKFYKVMGPGWVIVIPFIDDPYIVDLRVVSADIRPQDVVTKDNIRLQVDAIIFIKVTDPKAAVLNIENPTEAVTSYVQAHLRDVVGKMELESVISEVNIINDLLRKGLETVAKDWGITVDKIEIQSIELPPEVLSAMHQRKTAEQLKFAAEEEAKGIALKIDAIRRASEKLNDPALQYMYLQALEKIAEGRSTKIIFPLELTHMAARIAGGLPKQRLQKVEENLRSKYDEFLLEETREGLPISTEEILETLKKKTSKTRVKKHKRTSTED